MQDSGLRRCIRDAVRRCDHALQRVQLRQSLREVARRLDAETDRWFLEGGACLGYVRNGKPIAWDLDVDIGVYDPRIDFRRLARRLPAKACYGVGERVVELVVDTDAQIEIFAYFDYHGDIAEALINRARRLVKFLVYPRAIFEAGVERAAFAGVSCNVLRRADQYCRALYGDAYLVPDPAYDWWAGPRNAVSVTDAAIFAEEAANPAAPGRSRRATGPAIARTALRRWSRWAASLVPVAERGDREVHQTPRGGP
jgi:hypothetical protein